jgi:hypothetical protein
MLEAVKMAQEMDALPDKQAKEARDAIKGMELDFVFPEGYLEGCKDEKRVRYLLKQLFVVVITGVYHYLRTDNENVLGNYIASMSHAHLMNLMEEAEGAGVPIGKGGVA